MNIYGAIVPQRVTLNLHARDKAQLLAQIAQDAASATGLDQSMILTALQKREALGSTGVGKGIALPHAPLTGLTAAFGLLIRLARPIDFGAVDDKPVDIVFLLLTPPGDPKSDLAALSAIARTFRSGDVLTALRKAASDKDAQTIWADPV